MVKLKEIVVNLLRLRLLWAKGRVEIGAYTTGTPYVISDQHTPVVIGKFCSIGPDVIMIPSRGHIPSPEYREYRISTNHLARLSKQGFKPSYSLPGDTTSIHIGNDVWVGARAIILADVRVGDGAIIGAGAVVTKDVPPYAIVAGIPAEVKRYRYTKSQIEELLRIAWWNWDVRKIAENMDYFYGEVGKFIEQFSKPKQQ
jgi:acetyltransferase-like isoleucine patch superfamily enzyme